MKNYFKKEGFIMGQKMKNKLKNIKGFTLIELIVVIAIIAILAAVLIPRFTGFTVNARQKAAVSDARNILLAVEALSAQGDTSITMNEIIGYTGKTFPGTLSTMAVPGLTVSGTSNPLGGPTFWYTRDTNYRVYVEDGSIDTEFTEVGALVWTAATESHYVG